MAPIRIVVSGSGHMGTQVLEAIAREDGLEPVGVIEKYAKADSVEVPGSAASIPMSVDPAALIAACRPDVVIDFTNAEWAPAVAMAAVAAGARPVIGTSGLPEEFVAALRAECAAKGVGAFIAPNFAIGAVVMIHLAKVAARFFDYVEITEMHQERKVDAPSGTAVATASPSNTTSPTA
jgi:4-hydroxy-tetrahydrodipicolinate reductase